MNVTCTKRFNWPTEDGARPYFPGNVIDIMAAAQFAVANGLGEERGEQTPARVRTSPENKATDLKVSGGENKRDKKTEKKRAKNQNDDTMVLGSEDEIDQE